jgi:hypothetical protein
MQIRQHIASVLGTATSAVGAWASAIEHLDRVLSMGASVVAIITGVLTIRSILRKNRKQ